MSEEFDVIVVGMGPAGEAAAGRLGKAGKRVAVVEAELIGGECAYWACVPSKTLLRAAEADCEVQRAAGVSSGGLNWLALRDYRDYMIRHLDDSAQVKGYTAHGTTVVKGHAQMSAPGTVEVAGRTLKAADVVIATGSAALIPSIPGLDGVPVWTNREVTTLTEIPQRAVMIGGGAVGIEMSTFLARFGTKVTLIHKGERLLSREEPRVGDLAAAQLESIGVDVRTGTAAVRARMDGGDTVISLDDGGDVRTDVVVIGTGRSPRTRDLGLEHAGADLDDAGAIRVDQSCRAAEGLWAIGDVTAIMLFTHVGMYQARVAADTIAGTPRIANYEGIPRVVFGEPEIAAVGLTAVQASGHGHDVLTAEINLANTLTRPWTFEESPKGGTLGLVADARSNLLLGAYAIAPLASEWIHQAAQAIRARIPIDVQLDSVAQYPTYSEAYLKALERLKPLTKPPS